MARFSLSGGVNGSCRIYVREAGISKVNLDGCFQILTLLSWWYATKMTVNVI